MIQFAGESLPVFVRLLEADGSSVGEDLGRALGEFGSVIPHTDDRVSPDLVGVLDHSIEGFHSSVLADVGPLFYVAADNRFQPANDAAANAGRANDDAADDAEIFSDLSALYVEARSDDH